jgi:hypothetical protein
MNPLQSLDKEALLDVLTDYYQKFRDTVETNWNLKDYTLYHDSLMAILGELERRRDEYPTENQPRGNSGVPRP